MRPAKLRCLLVVGLAALLFSGHVGAVDREKVVVDRVEVTGFKAFSNQDIESLIEVSPGEAFDRSKILRTRDNIEAYYHVHGYQEATVSASLGKQAGETGETEMVLEFKIRERSPTKVASISFVPERIKDEEFRKFWRRFETGLSDKTGITSGDVFDQDKITAAKKFLQDRLASEEFIGAKINDVRVTSVSAPTTAKNDGSKWVALEFRVDLGDRVSFGFRGNTIFTEGYLSSLVQERRQLGFGKDYIADVAEQIRSEYLAYGYAQAEVKSYVFEMPSKQERHVTYTINEGPRVKIESLAFDGNRVFSTPDLKKQFYAKASEELRHGYFVEKDVQSAADLLIEWMKADGYLGAKLVTISSVYPPQPKTKVQNGVVRLTVYLYEGDQTLVQSVNYTGLHVFNAQEMNKMLGVANGEPLNLAALTSGMDTLKAAYRAKGYLGIKITNENDTVVQYSEENKVADVRVDLNEGPQFRVSKIFVEGLTQTRENVVRREIAFKEGEILEEPEIIATESRLRKLGIFSGVTIRVLDDPEKENYKTVRIIILEGTPGIVAGGAGLRNDLGVRLFGQVAYTNVGGRDQTLSFNAAVNHRFQDYRFIEYQGQLAYLWPWFAGHEITFRPSLTVSATEYVNLDAKELSLAFTWEKQLLRKPSLNGLITYQLERIIQFDSTVNPSLDNQQVRIGSVTPALQLDLRNNPLAPTSGFYAEASDEIALPAFFSQSDPFHVGYTKFQFRSDAFIPVNSDIYWFISFRTGFEREIYPQENGNPQSGQIPAVKLFTLGGAGSIRGFSEQGINTGGDAILGTLAFTNYRTQIDFPFSGALRFGPFFDAGNLFIDRLPFGSLREGAGAGFHYQTPIGPVNLDWGFNLQPQQGESPNEIYFSIGII